METIMSDRDSDHMLLELQEARAEIDRLRELLRWRDSKKESPIENADYLVDDKYFLHRFARYKLDWLVQYSNLMAARFQGICQ